MFVTVFSCVVLIFMAIYFNIEGNNAKERNEILKLERKLKEIELNRIIERQKYVNVILDFEKENNNE